MSNTQKTHHADDATLAHIAKLTIDEQIASQRRLVELYDADTEKNNYDCYRQRLETAILATLEHYKRITEAEAQVPVEPMPEMWLASLGLPLDFKLYPQRAIDALQSALRRVRAESEKWRSLVAEGERNFQTMCEEEEHWRERAETAERQLAERDRQLAEAERDAKDRLISDYEEWLSVQGENAAEATKRAETAERQLARETARADSWVKEVRDAARELGIPDEDSNGSIHDWRHIKYKLRQLAELQDKHDALVKDYGDLLKAMTHDKPPTDEQWKAIRALAMSAVALRDSEGGE